MSILPGGRPKLPAATLALLAGLAVWLWPIGLGGRMPVGGDSTQFSIGLMAELARALREWRLPLWNDLWGFGFPGLAESQMGVYYPPHWPLYGLLPLEAAYTAGLVLHTTWAGLGAAWAARRFGASAAGSALAGFAWAACGFYAIHLPHQWATSTGSWMPWAWGLAWRASRGEGPRRDPWMLAAVLAVQTLPGHFQLAFATQVSVLAIAGAALVGGRPRGAFAVGLGWLAAAPLAAAQLWPTYQLAALAESRRDYEYLSGFAATPLHLVSYVAPGLFRRSPLWRPVAWDPFHTSPEEYLGYVGLVPLFLAVAAVIRGIRRDPAVRVLALLAVLTLLLSLGPYVPGFSALIRLPGFGFFRAPARWGLGTGLALAILAARGFDLLAGWPRAGRALAAFALLTLAWPAAVVGAFELALWGTAGPGRPAVAGAFGRAMDALPWEGDPDFRAVMAAARRSQEADLRVQAGLARHGRDDYNSPRVTLERDRAGIYLRELGPTAILAAALLGLAGLSRRPRAFAAGLVLLTAADLLVVRRDAPTDLGPIRPLVEQSPVLARMASAPRGLRTLDPMRNLPMAAAAAPVSAYRTLDLPAMPALVNRALTPPSALGRFPQATPAVAGALRLTGAGLRVVDWTEQPRPGEAAPVPPGWREAATLSDPALASWLYGAAWVETRGESATAFRLLEPDDPPAIAWHLPTPDGSPPPTLLDPSAGPEAVMAAMAGANPLPSRRVRPEVLEVDLSGVGPGVVVLAQLDHPNWRATLDGTPSPVLRAFDGWQMVRLAGPFTRTLQLVYSGYDTRQGLAASGLAWAAWLASLALAGRRAKGR